MLEPNGERILADVRYLSETIGPRPTGTPFEKQAADFIANRLRDLGYEVRLQEFSAGSESARASALSVHSPFSDTVPTLPFARSATATVRAPLVAAANGKSGQFPSEARGAIVLIGRDGVTPFNTMVSNAQAAGARGAVIFNNEDGIFLGNLADDASIPAVSISAAEGQSLLSDLSKGPLEVEISVGAISAALSYNVIAVPPGRDCETVSGGHYDSVPQAPGASDNATGTATVLELASVLAKNGQMGSNCFVLFGAEEIGLVGSRAYVASLDAAARQRLKAMLNFDMVGVGDDTWLLIGTGDLQRRASAQAQAMKIDVTQGQLPISTSSDHASFIEAGIPSLMFHRLEDNLLHTPQDIVAGRVDPELLEQAARMGLALLGSLSGS
jgi:aminopeptidase YwaD